MGKYKSIEEIDGQIGLTPWEKEIEKVILNNPQSLAHAAPDLLRLVAKMKNRLESDLHWHNSPQITNHIVQANEIIEQING